VRWTASRSAPPGQRRRPAMFSLVVVSIDVNVTSMVTSAFGASRGGHGFPGRSGIVIGQWVSRPTLEQDDTSNEGSRASRRIGRRFSHVPHQSLAAAGRAPSPSLGRPPPIRSITLGALPL
jgi:hypothetical protein